MSCNAILSQSNSSLPVAIFCRSPAITKRNPQLYQAKRQNMKAAPLFDRAAHYNPARLYPVYVAGEKELLGHIAKLYGDFWRPQKFARLCAPLRHLTEKDFETGEN